jgi:recombination protein RecT
VGQAAALGLDCSGNLGSGYLVPFYNSKIRAMEAQFIAGYRGLVDLARRSGSILDIQAHVVYAADEFVYRLGLHPVLDHVPNFDVDHRDEDITGAYAIAWIRDAEPHPEYMSRRELDAVMNASKSKDKQGNVFGPWKDYYAEMCKKTVVRRIVKMLPLSIEAADAIARADEEQEPVEAYRPRREVSRLDISEQLGKAMEKDTPAGGSAETAPQPESGLEEGEVLDPETGEVTKQDAATAAKVAAQKAKLAQAAAAAPTDDDPYVPTPEEEEAIREEEAREAGVLPMGDADAPEPTRPTRRGRNYNH